MSSPLGEALVAVLERKRLFAGVAASVFALVAGVTIRTRPVYRATSLLMIESRNPNVANVQEVYDPNPANAPINDFYRTQHELLRSRRVLEPAAAALGLASRPEFAGARDPVEAFAQRVIVEPVRDSRLVRVSVESTDARFAADAANEVVGRFVEDAGRRVAGLSGEGLAQLHVLEAALAPKHEAAARELQRFMEENAIVSIDESQSTAAQRLRILSEELTHVQVLRAREAAQVETLERALGNPGGALGMPASRVLEELELTRARALEELEELRRRYGPEHPQVRSVESRIAGAEAHMAEQRAAILAAARTQLAATASHERELAHAVEDARQVVTDLGRKAVRLEILKRSAELAEASWKAVAHRIEELELVAATGARTGNFCVVDRAECPVTPVRPRRGLNLLLGLVAALATALVACVGLAQLAPRRENGEREDAASEDEPPLYYVPVYAPGGEEPGESEPIVILDDADVADL